MSFHTKIVKSVI